MSLYLSSVTCDFDETHSILQIGPSFCSTQETPYIPSVGMQLWFSEELNSDFHIFKGNLWCLDCRVSTSTGDRGLISVYAGKKKLICSYWIDNTKFPCSQECGKILSQFTSLRKHMLVQSHACNECGSASVERSYSKNIGIYMQDSSRVRCERNIPLRSVFPINTCLCTYVRHLPPALNVERFCIHLFVLNKKHFWSFTARQRCNILLKNWSRRWLKMWKKVTEKIEINDIQLIWSYPSFWMPQDLRIYSQDFGFKK